MSNERLKTAAARTWTFAWQFGLACVLGFVFWLIARVSSGALPEDQIGLVTALILLQYAIVIAIMFAIFYLTAKR